MKHRRRIGVSLIAGLFVAAAAWGLLVTAPNHEAVVAAQNGVQLESISGTVATVARDSFTLTTIEVAPQSENLTQVDNTTRTMFFVIDHQTTIQGKLQVDATVDVVYRLDAGNNLAVSVIVRK
jgi:hypothetical protein